MNTYMEIWDHLLTGQDSERLLNTAIQHVANGLSKLMGTTIYYTASCIKEIPLSQVSTLAGPPGSEMVGIYLRMESGLLGQTVVLLPLNIALNLADLVMHTPSGTARHLGILERSALGETGNLMLSYFLNAVADLLNSSESLLPSPPAVIVDMLGAILDIIVTPVALEGDDLTFIETVFRDVSQVVSIRFWILPHRFD